MYDLNDSLLGRLAWRIISNRVCLLSQIYFAKYCKNEANIVFSYNSSSSSLTRPTYVRINAILKDFHWRVGDGRSININGNQWIKPEQWSKTSIQVYQLTDGSRNWIKDFVHLFYLEPSANKILNIPLSKTGIKDRIVWTK